MQNAIQTILFPEIFIGFVSPVGTDIAPTLDAFADFFKQQGYDVVYLKVTDYFKNIKSSIEATEELSDNHVDMRILSYIKFGNYVRARFQDDSVLAAYTIFRIMRERIKLSKKRRLPKSEMEKGFEKTVYLIHQFKRKEEVDLFRSVYGRLFFQVSVYSRRDTRLYNLSKNISHSYNSADYLAYMSKANDILVKDENEKDDKHGQRVSKIFHDADFIVSSDLVIKTVRDQVFRFCELLFSANNISPSRMEYGMFAAKGAALRTLDLSRQVGAAIFRSSGEVIAMGSNEVPKADGGTYWSDQEPYDAREYVKGEDSNDARKMELLSELASALGVKTPIDELVKIPAVKDSQFMDALEYGRIVHAEMSAISDAARLGLPLKNSVLYCTTFPCHMCAKHIVSSGLDSVIFLEPYPKSLASDLHSDSIEIERGARGNYKDYDAVKFEHFFGITPRRYRELFEREKRKSGHKFEKYISNIKRPFVNYKYAFYKDLERNVIDDGMRALSKIVQENSNSKDI